MDVTLALLLDESGASMIEYGFLIALIAMAVLTATRTLGTSVSALFGSAAGKVPTTPLHY